tara:strand:- start:482 stop:625 length:144 start_codon:yes stop_codon:yes gene_type:complete
MKPESDDNILSKLMKSSRYKPYEKYKSRLTEPIIILDSKTEFDGRES